MVERLLIALVHRWVVDDIILTALPLCLSELLKFPCVVIQHFAIAWSSLGIELHVRGTDQKVGQRSLCIDVDCVHS